MKCLVCKNEDSEVPNYFVPIYVLLHFFTQWTKLIDIGGEHLANSLLFTPIGKSTIEAFCCPICKEKINRKCKRIKKITIVSIILTLIIALLFNYFLVKYDINIFYYLINLIFILVILSLYGGFSMQSIDEILFIKLRNSKGLTEEINLISNKIDFSAIPFLNLNEKTTHFKNGNNVLSFHSEDLLFICQNSYELFPPSQCVGIGHDGNRVWFEPASNSFCYTSLVYGDHRITVNSYSYDVSIINNFKKYSKSEQISFEQYIKRYDLKQL